MSIRGKRGMAGIGETPTDRLGGKPGETRKSTAEYLAWAARLAMEDAGLTKKDFDGQGLAAIYTTNHSQPFWPEEVAARARCRCWGIPPRQSSPGYAISCWSLPPPRLSVSAAAIEARPRIPAI